MLENICRLCGEWKQYHYPVKDYEQDLKNIFHIDISTDQEDIHGQVLCDNHVRLVNRYKMENPGKTYTNKDMLYNFAPHSGDDCDICARTLIPKTKKTSRKLPATETPPGKTSEEMRTLFKDMKPEDRVSFLMCIPQLCSEDERSVLAYYLGKYVSPGLLAEGMAMPQISFQSSLQYDAKDWLHSRNDMLVKFITGAANLASDVDYSVRTTLLINKVIEQVHYLRDSRLTLPLSFPQNLFVQIKYGSKQAVDMNAVLSPGDCYVNNRKWLSQQKIPDNTPGQNDVVYIFDNEQKFVGRRGMQQSARLTIITNVAYVNFEETIQFLQETKPKKLLTVSDIEREEAVAEYSNNREYLSQLAEKKTELRKTITSVLKQDYPEVHKHERLHQNQLLHHLEHAVKVVNDKHTRADHDDIDNIIMMKDQMLCGKCKALYPLRTKWCANDVCRKESLQKWQEDNTPQKGTTTLYMEEHEEEEPTLSIRYSNVECGDDTPRKMVISEPVLCNPASKLNIAYYVILVSSVVSIFMGVGNVVGP